MITTTVVIPSMKNQHDADKVNRALHEIWGINKVDINLSGHEATFSYDEAAASFHDFQEAITELGFDIVIEDGVTNESLHDWHLERIARENVYKHDL
jgi:copper chaperone